MTERSIACAGLLHGRGYDLRGPCRLSLDGGRIAGVAGIDGEADPLFALPVPVNAHDHGRPVRSSSFGAAGKPLELWLQYLALLPAVVVQDELQSGVLQLYAEIPEIAEQFFAVTLQRQFRLDILDELLGQSMR